MTERPEEEIQLFDDEPGSIDDSIWCALAHHELISISKVTLPQRPLIVRDLDPIDDEILF